MDSLWRVKFGQANTRDMNNENNGHVKVKNSHVVADEHRKDR